MQGTVTAANASEVFPEHFFFGLQENNTLKLVTRQGEIVQPQAHTAMITAIEAT